MHRIQSVLFAGILILSACQASTPPAAGPGPVRPAGPGASPAASPAGSGSQTFTAEIWVDNWFALYVDGEKAGEDSVPITTERSFNAERLSFRADYPFVLALELKDYKADDSGLEYLGRPNQQMGDGGAIAQVSDATGKRVALSDSSWKCLTIHRAPLDKRCESEARPVPGTGPCGFEAREAPAGWTRPDFDDSAWAAASVHAREQVGPKDGYDRISWDPQARFIWGPDLETDNTVLCRRLVTGP